MRTFIENYLHFMKNCIRPPYEKLKSLKSGFIENSNFENNRDPCGSIGALLVGGCGARAVFRKTPIYFIYLMRTVFLSLHNSLEHSRRPKVSWLQVRGRLWNMLELNWRRCLKVRWRNEPCLKVRWRHLKWMAHRGKSAEDRLENKSWPTETVCLILSS